MLKKIFTALLWPLLEFGIVAWERLTCLKAPTDSKNCAKKYCSLMRNVNKNKFYATHQSGISNAKWHSLAGDSVKLPQGRWAARLILPRGMGV